jgi:hypothetical protein
MEERTSTEMLDRNNVIETLKCDVDVLGDENTKLSAKVTRLSAETSEVADLRLEVASFHEIKREHRAR